MIDIPPTALVTVNGLASAAGLPPSTVNRRLEKLGIIPDEELFRGHQPVQPLFRGDRAAQLVQALLATPHDR
ncbi:MAG: winged helix-turn-helix domain-containing protein [Verrucomicrobia bacterium]|nr:winged helix-turn-helix domain-containing protein [Verrucomicrobiota bacterium]